MKKIIAAALAAAGIMGVSAYAGSIQAENAASKTAVAAFYDTGGRLAAVKVFAFDENGLADIDFPTEDMRLFIPDEHQEISAPTPEATAPPEATASPEAATTPEATAAPTALPEATSTPAPTQKPTPEPIYSNESDATRTFSVVKDVSMVSENGESKTELTIYNRGQEKRVRIDNDVRVTATAPAWSAEDGMAVSSLSEGDVIILAANFGGEIKTVDLVYRPSGNPALEETDYGASYEDLFSEGGTVGSSDRNKVISYGSAKRGEYYSYAMGCIFKKTDSSLILYAKDGKNDTSLDFSLSPDTMVYLYDGSSSDPLSIGTIYDISASDIAEENVDDDLNVIKWSSDDILNFALVRESDGIVTDVMVFEDYR